MLEMLSRGVSVLKGDIGASVYVLAIRIEPLAYVPCMHSVPRLGVKAGIAGAVTGNW